MNIEGDEVEAELDLKDKHDFIVQTKQVLHDEDLDIIFGNVWDGKIEVKFQIKIKTYKKFIDNSLIEIKKFKMTDLHADLDEACMQIVKFDHLGKPWKRNNDRV